MAIKKFVQAQTYDQTAFGAWLNANKEGTFLENMTITVDDWNGTNDRLTIDNGSEYMIYYAEQSKVDITYFYIRSGMDPNRTTNSKAWVKQAILCNHGLMLQYYGSDGNNNYSYYWNCLTIDDDGKLAYITTTGQIPHANNNVTTDNNIKIYSASSTAVADIYLYTSYNRSKTILTPISLETPTPSTLPYAFIAVQSELTGLGLQGVRMNNEDYITNGTFYVKD